MADRETDWRGVGVDAAHEDRRGRGEPCLAIEEARRRIGAWLRSSSEGVTDAQVEAAARGYLDGWADDD